MIIKVVYTENCNKHQIQELLSLLHDMILLQISAKTIHVWCKTTYQRIKYVNYYLVNFSR